MNDYTFSDYGIFKDAIEAIKTLNQKIVSENKAVSDSKRILSNESLFMGPVAIHCLEVASRVNDCLMNDTSKFDTMANYLQEVSSNYQAGDQAATKVLSLNSSDQLTSSSISLTGSTNQEQIYNYFTSQGLNQAAACGILANIKQESNFKTGDWGDNGTSYGICQWHASRLTELQNYCSSNNLDYNTLEGQLSFLTYELQTKYPDLYQTLQNVPNNADGAYQAAYQFTIRFERPADMEWRGEQRGYSAQDMLQSYGQQ